MSKRDVIEARENQLKFFWKFKCMNEYKLTKSENYNLKIIIINKTNKN